MHPCHAHTPRRSHFAMPNQSIHRALPTSDSTAPAPKPPPYQLIARGSPPSPATAPRGAGCPELGSCAPLGTKTSAAPSRTPLGDTAGCRTLLWGGSESCNSSRQTLRLELARHQASCTQPYAPKVLCVCLVLGTMYFNGVNHSPFTPSYVTRRTQMNLPLSFLCNCP